MADPTPTPLTGAEREALAEVLGSITLLPEIWLNPGHMDKIVDTIAPMLAAARADERERVLRLASRRLRDWEVLVPWRVGLRSGTATASLAPIAGNIVRDLRAALAQSGSTR